MGDDTQECTPNKNPVFQAKTFRTFSPNGCGDPPSQLRFCFSNPLKWQKIVSWAQTRAESNICKSTFLNWIVSELSLRYASRINMFFSTHLMNQHPQTTPAPSQPMWFLGFHTFIGCYPCLYHIVIHFQFPGATHWKWYGMWKIHGCFPHTLRLLHLSWRFVSINIYNFVWSVLNCCETMCY